MAAINGVVDSVLIPRAFGFIIVIVVLSILFFFITRGEPVIKEAIAIEEITVSSIEIKTELSL